MKFYATASSNISFGEPFINIFALRLFVEETVACPISFSKNFSTFLCNILSYKKTFSLTVGYCIERHSILTQTILKLHLFTHINLRRGI